MRIGFIFGLVMCGCFSAVAAGAQQQRPSLPTDPSAVLTMQGIQTAQLAETWLHSGDPRLQAWSAYVILRDHHGSLIPDLVKMVSEYDVAAWPIADGRRDQHDAMIAILDALIELRGPVLTADAARLYPEFPVQSLILLSLEGDPAFPYLLDIFRNEHSQRDAWLGAGNMLAQRRIPGFAAAVLGNFTVRARIRVTTSGEPEAGSGIGGSCASSGEGKAGWPVVGNYSFAWRRTGAILLADGADPVYYMRWVSGAYDRNRDQCCGPCTVAGPELDTYREHYLTTLLYAPLGNPSVRAYSNKEILWEGSAAYLAFLRSVVSRQEQLFSDVAGKLINAGLMTDEDAVTARPRLEITIVDDREDKTAPLPRFENLGENVTVKM
jgi:hypothetical protein